MRTRFHATELLSWHSQGVELIGANINIDHSIHDFVILGKTKENRNFAHVHYADQ